MAIQQILILSLIQEIVVAGSDSVDDTPECWKYGFNEDANPTLGNNCAHPYDEQTSVQAQIRRETVSFTAEFVFSFDKFTLRNEAVDTLNVLAMRSADNRLQISVVGHADFKVLMLITKPCLNVVLRLLLTIWYLKVFQQVISLSLAWVNQKPE